MNVKQYIRYETPEAAYELYLAITQNPMVAHYTLYELEKMSDEELESVSDDDFYRAIAMSLKSRYGDDIDAIRNELLYISLMLRGVQ